MKYLLIIVGMLLGMSAHADVVNLNNGDRISGTIDSIAGGRLLIVTEYAGNVVISMDQVASLETDAEFQVRVGGQRMEGVFALDGEDVTLGGTPVAMADVQTAALDNLEAAEFGEEWSSRADLTAVISNGNSDTQSFNALIESIYKKDTVEHAFSLLLSNEEAEEETTKDQLDFDYGYKRFLSEKWYASGNFEYFKDELKDIDARYTAGAGMGYQFWDNSFGAFSTDLSVNYVREDIGDENESNPALRWGLAWNRFLMAKKLELFHKQSILWIPDSDRGEVLSSSTGARYALSERIDATFRTDVTHETEPAPGNGKTDVTHTLGVGIKF